MENQKLKPNNSSMYYNTTNVTGQQRELFQEKATTQNEKVLQLFKRFKTPLSPSQVLKYYIDSANTPNSSKTPITSIRRSITTLTERGELIKTEFQIDGPYNRPEFLWRLKEPNSLSV